jgi:hypothetical protein
VTCFVRKYETGVCLPCCMCRYYSTLGSIKGPRRRTFTETQIIFAHNQQHGYFLYPQRGLKYDNRHPKGLWVKNNSFQFASPFEAFYSREGVWYYIGTYQGFIICDAPWEALSEWPEQVGTPGINYMCSADFPGLNKSDCGSSYRFYNPWPCHQQPQPGDAQGIS